MKNLYEMFQDFCLAKKQGSKQSWENYKTAQRSIKENRNVNINNESTKTENAKQNFLKTLNG